MTKTEACKILKVSSSASSAKKEQAYRQIQKSLQLKLIPGHSLTERRMAREQLGKIATAYQVLQKSPAKKKPVHKRTATTRPAAKKTETLGSAWELLVSIMPLPEPILVILLLVIFLVVLVGLLRSF